MKILLCALNAKYIHSNLAVRYLKEYANSYLLDVDKVNIVIEEFSINQHFDEIMSVLYQHKPDKLFFSCYIWNISMVQELVVELSKVLPRCDIWLGGPEVSYNSEEILSKYPQLKGIVVGPGERAFVDIVSNKNLDEIEGISYLNKEDKIGKRESGHAKKNIKGDDVIRLDLIPFPYNDMEDFRHKIVYYESSRGCPFSCSYCLSSKECKIEFRSFDLVKKEIKHFIDNRVKQVKFVDRTFNCNSKRARDIWEFLHEYDRGITNFHFEIVAGLLTDEDLEVLEKLRPGLVQFEIGVQSTNTKTLKEIQRDMDFEKVATAVRRIKTFDNIHLHLDLIAGLPKEDYNSFASSFDHVYNLKPNKLQLGFLKVLKGSVMEEKAKNYDLVYQSRPPYQVLSTAWLTYDEILKLGIVEEMLEMYYNSGQFENTLNYLQEYFQSPFRLFEELGGYYASKGYLNISHSRQKRYELLIDFVEEKAKERTQRKANRKAERKVEEEIAVKSCDVGKKIIDKARFRQLLVLDYYLRENVKKRPTFAGEETVTKKEADEFYTKEAINPNYLVGYNSTDKRQLRKGTHLEKIGHELYLFDYNNIDNWKKQAKVINVTI